MSLAGPREVPARCGAAGGSPGGAGPREVQGAVRPRGARSPRALENRASGKAVRATWVGDVIFMTSLAELPNDS